MQTLREYLANTHHWTAHAVGKRRAVIERLGHFLGDDTPHLWIQAIAVFVSDRPWRYWDHTTVETALDLLNRDTERTAAALDAWRPQLNVGLDSLFVDSAAALSEENPRSFHVREIVRLGTVFHPEYLRYAEHVFGNLVTPFWGVQRKGAVSAKFDLPRAVGDLRRNHLEAVTDGFDDRIRNAVAHGEVTFRGVDIRYGPPIANHHVTPSAFVSTFDTLVRTSNALALAILLFWSQHHDLLRQNNVVLPIRLLGIIAAAAVDSLFVSFEGAYESELALAGRQFHVGLRTHLARREFVLMAAATVAYQLVDSGGVEYDRFNFEIEYGKNLQGLVIIDVPTLRKLLNEDAPVGNFSEILATPPLLWFNESLWRTRVRAWWTIMRSNLTLAREDFRLERIRLGVAQYHRGYWIRGFEDTSVGGLLRAQVHVVLRHPDDGSDRNRLREIARLAIRDAKRQWVKRVVGPFGSDLGWKAHPRQIGVRVYREDGPLRWLGQDGWMGGNLVAIAEWRRRLAVRYNHVFVPEPDEIWRGIRLQYGMSERARQLFSTNAEPNANA